MTNETFFIDDVELQAPLAPNLSSGSPFRVESSPRPYTLEWLDADADVCDFINNDADAILLVDINIKKKWLKTLRQDIPVFSVQALEKNKTVLTAIDFCEFLESKGTTKANMVYVVGGGIMQDIGGVACAMYKRGIPWTYLPTTLLGMADSCIGGKTGLNHKSTKNLLALFSAPRKIIHCLPFLETLPEREIISGFGEALRLHVTGGAAFLKKFETTIDAALGGDKQAIKSTILSSLAVKRAVVEEDEFEISLRRSMNYGHSVGHAIEALTNFAFPHGMAISIGMMVENKIAERHYGLDTAEANRININASKLVDQKASTAVKNVDLSSLNNVLLKDKKTIGRTLKMAVPGEIGSMYFRNFELDDRSSDIFRDAISSIVI